MVSGILAKAWMLQNNEKRQKLFLREKRLDARDKRIVLVCAAS